MLNSRTAVLAVGLAALAASGCTSTRFQSENTQPAPLPAVPSGQVSSQQLPPPAAPQSPAAFPTAPETQVASLPEPSANAPDLTAGSVAGVWNATVSGQSCKVATPQTKYGQGFRAGPLRCPAPLDGVKSWAVSGKQLTLYDEGGSTLARLYSSGAERFDGQTTSGVAISLSR
ncbi:MAG: protease inhibitor Inh/omp19 family protein [Rhizobiaceae bacterium]|nr:protease inhibitor Inh/omp19 family protein [Rhizobiaceae bacterium]